MSAKYSYIVKPITIDNSQKFIANHESVWSSNFVQGTAFVGLIGLLMVLFGGPAWLLIMCIVIILIYIAINRVMNEADDKKHTDRTIAEQITKAHQEAEFYSQKFNDILSKSEQLVNEILPYFESSAMQYLDEAKIDFTENAFSPFWSNIEGASNSLARFIEAVNQLCLNSEIYSVGLKSKTHNFPLPFPFATNISISKNVVDEYRTTVRTAQTNPTFSIIWEQRRNTQILGDGFKTLENAVNNMNYEITSAISNLNHSITSGLSELKYVQQEQLKTFQSSKEYLTNTLNSMDDKLYYIQWNKRPRGTFHHR